MLGCDKKYLCVFDLKPKANIVGRKGSPFRDVRIYGRLHALGIGRHLSICLAGAASSWKPGCWCCKRNLEPLNSVLWCRDLRSHADWLALS